MSKFEIWITSPPDRERVVAEIWYDKMSWAEISCEDKDVVVQFYPQPTNGYWEFPFDEAIEILQKAKNRLVSM